MDSIFELRDVTKYFHRTRVLNQINLRIERGKTTTIIGPSGCGKTVLLKHLIVLMRPSKGQVFFDGNRIDDRKEKRLIEYRRRWGFLFQSGALFDSQTVEENVAFPLRQHANLSEQNIQDRVEEKLEMVGLAHTKERLPSELSGGQQKRVALARAIALSPEVIFYDEPTTGLDPIRAQTINELILKLQRDLQITTIVVTHDMNSVHHIADRVVMLDQGCIIADGNVEEIRNSYNEKVQRFVHSQKNI
jgi:phospholipid/cholesterol/gamma-HCH transport system ATP-binding protein